MKTRLTLLLLLFFKLSNGQENYNMELRSHLPVNFFESANIGGYVDNQGNEYALIGTQIGMSIIDVTDPDHPVLKFQVEGAYSNWREVKTWQGYAYVTTEGSGGGLQIINLNQLPTSIDSHIYTGDGEIGGFLYTAHALHIDNGFCYVYGSNINNKGALIFDLADPWNPIYRGMYDEYYVHDGYVSNDTAWVCNIYEGTFSVVDVSNKAHPVTLAMQTTPGNFTHNSWLTDDHKTLLVTDEVDNSYLTSYDISNIGNITELDRFKVNTEAIVHNTHVLNDYAVTSWYTEGVVIVDAARPHNLIEVAKYDFSDFEGNSFNGCWGVYPFLPSGNLVASDMEQGLFVLTPTYKRACYLEGTVVDSLCGNPLADVTIQIQELNINDLSKLDGTYATGTVIPGQYTIVFSKEGFAPVTLTNVQLSNGVLTSFNITLVSDSAYSFQGSVVNTLGNPVTLAQVNFSSNSESFQLNVDGMGEYEKCDMLPDVYDFSVGRWGYKTKCLQDTVFSNDATAALSILEKGYWDDFQFDFGWSVQSTALKGKFERTILPGAAFPTANPSVDDEDDCNQIAFVTGKNFIVSPNFDDLDSGYTRLTSPGMNLSSYSDPYINFSYWMYNGYAGYFPNDSVFIYVSNDGGAPVLVSKLYDDSINIKKWNRVSFRLKDYIAQPSQVRFIVHAEEFVPDNVFEVGIDRFYISESAPIVGIESNPAAECQLDVYPIPSKDFVNVKWSFVQHQDNIEIQLMDMSGRQIHQQSISGMEGNTQLGAGLPSGVYIVRLCSDGRALSNKRIVLTH